MGRLSTAAAEGAASQCGRLCDSELQMAEESRGSEGCRCRSRVRGLVDLEVFGLAEGSSLGQVPQDDPTKLFHAPGIEGISDISRCFSLAGI